MTLWENKVRMLSVFAISSLLKKPYLVSEIIFFILHHCLLKSKFLYIYRNHSVSIPKVNTELKQTFAQYGVNTSRLDTLGSNTCQRVQCLDATYVQDVFLKLMLTTVDLRAKTDISYGGHFRGMGNPVNITAE